MMRTFTRSQEEKALKWRDTFSSKYFEDAIVELTRHRHTVNEEQLRRDIRRLTDYNIVFADKVASRLILSETRKDVTNNSHYSTCIFAHDQKVYTTSIH